MSKCLRKLASSQLKVNHLFHSFFATNYVTWAKIEIWAIISISRTLAILIRQLLIGLLKSFITILLVFTYSTENKIFKICLPKVYL